MKTYSRRQVAFKIIDDVCYVIDSFETKAAYKLNETSTSIWLHLEKDKSLTELVSCLMEEFEDIDAAELEQDIKTHLDELIQNSLVHES